MPCILFYDPSWILIRQCAINLITTLITHILRIFYVQVVDFCFVHELQFHKNFVCFLQHLDLRVIEDLESAYTDFTLRFQKREDLRARKPCVVFSFVRAYNADYIEGYAQCILCYVLLPKILY